MQPISLLKKIELVNRINPKLTFKALICLAFIVLILSSVVSNYFTQRTIRKVANYEGTSPVWERSRGGRTEYFFKINYGYNIDGKKYSFHLEKGFSDKEKAEIELKNFSVSGKEVWYEKNRPGNFNLNDPTEIYNSPFYISFHLVSFLLFVGLLVRKGDEISTFYNEEIANTSVEKTQFYSSQPSTIESVFAGFKLKFLIQYIIIIVIAGFYHHTLEWITIIAWLIISLELASSIFQGLRQCDNLSSEFSVYHKHTLLGTLSRFGKILKDHFGINGKIGAIDINSLGSVFFLVIFIYLPFIVLPLLAINCIRLIISLFFSINNKIASIFLKLFSTTDALSEIRKGMLAFSYSVIFVGLILISIYSAIHTTLIK